MEEEADENSPLQGSIVNSELRKEGNLTPHGIRELKNGVFFIGFSFRNLMYFKRDRENFLLILFLYFLPSFIVLLYITILIIFTSIWFVNVIPLLKEITYLIFVGILTGVFCLVFSCVLSISLLFYIATINGYPDIKFNVLKRTITVENMIFYLLCCKLKCCNRKKQFNFEDVEIKVEENLKDKINCTGNKENKKKKMFNIVLRRKDGEENEGGSLIKELYDEKLTNDIVNFLKSLIENKNMIKEIKN